MNAAEKIAMHNLILISGNGRNSGKTLFARMLIAYFSDKQAVTAIKISPHFHPVNSKNILLKKEHFTICNEQDVNNKDSSLMLQAGATRVLYMMAKQEYLKVAFTALKRYLPDGLLICESGGLYKIVKPGIHFFIKENGTEIVKPISPETQPIVVNRTENRFDFSIQNIQFKNNTLKINNGTI